MSAFQSLVEKHSSDVFRLAYRITGNEHDAEDAVQDTFLRAFQKLSTFDGRAKFGTWLYRVAANSSLDVLRRRRRDQSRGPSLEDSAAGRRARNAPLARSAGVRPWADSQAGSAVSARGL